MKTYLLYPTEEREKLLQAFLEANDITFLIEEEMLPDFVLEGITKGQEDIKAGRFITHEEFKKRMTSAK
jgi:predicted transcriptional regulator